MSESVKKWIKLILSTIGLFGFILCYRALFLGNWNETNQPTANFLQLTSGLTGMVSGVVATIFGVKIPDGGGAGIANKLIAIGGFISPFKNASAKQIIAVLYVTGYFVMALWAIIIWIGPENSYRPQIIDGLAAVGLGLGLAVVTGFLGNSKK